MSALLRKLLVINFEFIVFFLLLTNNSQLITVHAQTASPSAIPNPIPYTLYPIPSNVSPTSPIFTDLLINNIFHSFSCIAVGQSVIGQPCLTYLKGIPMLSQVNTSGGLLGTTTSLIAALYMNPPVRIGDYLATVGDSLGVVKEVHAQGIAGSGNSVLSPIITLWQISRNIAYLAMIIIFVVIGLMVIFRSKINPQTVITAQAALPGLIIGLILITFSYFLASLITDFAFVGTDIVGFYFQQVPKTDISPQGDLLLTQRSGSENLIGIFSDFINRQGRDDYIGAADTLINHLSGWAAAFVKGGAALLSLQYAQIFGGPAAGLGAGVCTAIAIAGGTAATAASGPVAPVTGLAALAGAGQFIGACANIARIVTDAMSGIVGGTSSLINTSGSIGTGLWILAMIFLIFAMIRLILRLVQNYLMIIFLTVTAPFSFLFSAIPGRQSAATDWVQNMLCNVLSFPAVFAVFYFVAYLIGPYGNQHALDPVFGVIKGVDLEGSRQTLPLLGGLNLSFIKTLLAYGALIATPSIPDIVCRTIGKPSQAGEMIQRNYAAIAGQGQGYVGQARTGIDTATGVYSRFGELRDQTAYQRMSDGKYRIIHQTPGYLTRVREREQLKTAAVPKAETGEQGGSDNA